MKIFNWIRKNPILSSIIGFMVLQTVINIALANGLIQTQELLKALTRTPLKTWRV